MPRVWENIPSRFQPPPRAGWSKGGEELQGRYTCSRPRKQPDRERRLSVNRATNASIMPVDDHPIIPAPTCLHAAHDTGNAVILPALARLALSGPDEGVGFSSRYFHLKIGTRIRFLRNGSIQSIFVLGEMGNGVRSRVTVPGGLRGGCEGAGPAYEVRIETIA